MADTVQTAYTSGTTLYFQVRNAAGEVYNSDVASFEAYDNSNWADYEYEMAEQGVSGVFTGAFPLLTGGLYGWIAFHAVSGTAAEGDLAISGADANWDGAAFQVVDDLAAIVGTAVLTNPAWPIVTNASGEVVASNMRGTDSANTTTPPTVGAIATETWDTHTPRTLTAFGSIAADVATAVWAFGTRTLSAFGFTITTVNEVANTVILDKLDDTFELDSGNQRFTEASLAEAPVGGDATEAKQDTGIAAIAALNDLAVSDIKSAVQATLIDGAVDLQEVLKRLMAVSSGKFVQTGFTDPFEFEFKAEDDSTTVVTLTFEADGSGRVN